MTGTLGVCIIGCGYMGRIHAESWDKLPQAAVVAVVDIRYLRAQRLANQLNCAPYQDYREAILRPDVDVVSICIPTNLHAEATIKAADHGKHVLCEKPIALTVEDADQMIAAAQKNKVRLGIGFMRRHSTVLHDLKGFLAEGRFGRPVLYHATDIRELRPKREMHDARANGGPVIDMAVHLIDLWSMIFDARPVSVSASGLRLAKHRPEISHIRDTAVDTATITVKYETGDMGSFLVSWGLPPNMTPPELCDRIIGPHGLGEVYYQRQKQELRSMQEGGGWQTLSICTEDMYHAQVKCFAESILMGAPFPVTAAQGKSALRVSLAALESIQVNRSVNLI